MFLERTIGYLENEQESFLTVQYILFGSLAYMIVGSLLEGLLFYLYNEKFLLIIVKVLLFSLSLKDLSCYLRILLLKTVYSYL